MPERRIHIAACPCRDLNPGPARYQADMLPIELSWLGHRYSQLTPIASRTKKNMNGTTFSYVNTSRGK